MKNSLLIPAVTFIIMLIGCRFQKQDRSLHLGVNAEHGILQILTYENGDYKLQLACDEKKYDVPISEIQFQSDFLYYENVEYVNVSSSSSFSKPVATADLENAAFIMELEKKRIFTL